MNEQTTAAAREQTGAVAGTVKDEAGTVAATAVQAGGDVAATAKEQATQVVGETVRQARDLVGEVRQQVSGQASAQTQQLSEKVRSLAGELTEMAEKSDQSGLGAEIVRQVAERGHSLADYLERREPGDLIDDLRIWARRKPGGFLAGAALAGVVAGRLTRGVKDATSSDSAPASIPAASATGVPTAGLGVAPGAGAEAGYAGPPFGSASYTEPLANGGPLDDDPALATPRPDTSGI